MAMIATRPMTAEEFDSFVSRPENADRFFELDEGEVIELTRPKPLHGFIYTRVAFLLTLYCQRRGRGYVLSNDTGVILSRDPDTVRGPDVMLYDDGKSYGDLEAEESWPETPPALAVEVLSPSDRHGQIARKVAQYLNAGVGLVWVVDPPSREVTVHRRDAEPVVTAAGGTLEGGDLLPGLSVMIDELFRGPGEQ